jgi:xanthine dehydrogenase accessory factor
MSGWVGTLRSALSAEARAVVITVAAARGSTPREAGAKMIVTAKTVQGTIGGGHLEFEAIRIAREALEFSAHDAWLARFPLAARLGQCCGGVATLLFQRVEAHAASWLDKMGRSSESDAPLVLISRISPDPFSPILLCANEVRQAELPPAVVAAAERAFAQTEATPMLTADGAWFIERVERSDFRLVVFGNGHVGRALVQVLGTLPCAVTWVDERENDFPPSVPANVTMVVTDAPEDEVGHAAPGSWFLVMTHSHALDLKLVRAILGRADFGYLGLIGSASKRAQFERRLTALGVPRSVLARMTCPIGVAGIRSKAPGAIAIAVAAQLLELHERDTALAQRRVAR